MGTLVGIYSAAPDSSRSVAFLSSTRAGSHLNLAKKFPTLRLSGHLSLAEGHTFQGSGRFHGGSRKTLWRGVARGVRIS